MGDVNFKIQDTSQVVHARITLFSAGGITVEIEQVEGGVNLIITDDKGEHVGFIADGKPGSQGEKGEKGDKGDTGETGATGAKGDKGEKGDTGATGATGPQGPAGNDGYTPVKGTDYWTAADKSSIVQDVLAELYNAAQEAI